MVENQRKRYRLPYLANYIFQPSKLKIVQGATLDSIEPDLGTTRIEICMGIFPGTGK